MKHSSSGISHFTLGDTTLVWVYGESTQHVNLPNGMAINIDPSISEVVVLGEANVLAITKAGLYMVIESLRFSRVDVVDTTVDDFWKFITSIVIDTETQEQIKLYAKTAKERFKVLHSFTAEVVKKLPQDGYVSRLIFHLSKLNLRSSFREILTATKEAHPEKWAKLKEYLSDSTLSFVENQIPDQKS